MKKSAINKALRQYIKEDLSTKGDITTDLFDNHNKNINSIVDFYIINKNPTKVVICGLNFISAIFTIHHAKLDILYCVAEGQIISHRDIVLRARAQYKDILKFERTSLNILQNLSAIATQTFELSAMIKHTGVRLLDTRKTIPGFRIFQKYAVLIGGGINHRFGLFDRVLIKDNHIAICGGMENTLKHLVSLGVGVVQNIEIECSDIKQIELVLLYAKRNKLPITRIMLDNFSVESVMVGIRLIRSSRLDIEIELSGGINKNNILDYAETKPNFISIGALTHSVTAVDFSLEIDN